MKKAILVIGASSGIGEACVHELSNENTIIFAVGRNKERLESIRDESIGEVVTIRYDLRNLENIKEIFDVVKFYNVKLDGMVYSAGVDGMWPIKINDTTHMQEMMLVNCFAFVETARRFYSARYSNLGASVVAISSIASITNEMGMSSYNASKSALNSYVKSMAKEFRSREVRVNALLPVGVKTPMADKKRAAFGDILKETDTSKEMLSSVDVAREVASLLSENCQYNGEWISMEYNVRRRYYYGGENI